MMFSFCPNRFANLYKSPSRQEMTVPFQITVKPIISELFVSVVVDLSGASDKRPGI